MVKKMNKRKNQEIPVYSVEVYLVIVDPFLNREEIASIKLKRKLK